MCSIRRAAKALLYGAAYFGIPRVRPSVRRRVPHDTAAFTQGLATWGGWLFESTGGHGHSSLRRLRLDTGEVLAMVDVPDDFAEGIAVSDDRLYQLSWTSGRVRVYALPDLAGLGELAHAGEGWGLCAGIDGFYATDGSSWIRVLDGGLREIRRVRVTANGIPIHWLNDLECVGERLLVNVVGRNDLLEVDRLSGKVTRLVDCSELARQAGKMPADWVFNGVTCDPESGCLVVTGKNWPYLFFIDIPR